MIPRQIALIIAILLCVAFTILSITDSPKQFRSPRLRFLNRTGLILFSRTLPVPPGYSLSGVRPSGIERLMSDSSFIILAQRDDPNQFLLMDFIVANGTPLFPLPMRAVLRFKPSQASLTLRGYATWSYPAAILATAIFTAGALPSDAPATACSGIILLALLVFSALMYAAQARRFGRLLSHISSTSSADTGLDGPAA